MNSKVKVMIPWTIIVLLLLFLAVNYFLSSLNYSPRSQLASPDGQYIVHEFQSLNEGGHAPYGILLSLSSKKSIHHPEEGHVFFAGYCQPLTYSWNGNSKIFVKCHAKDKSPIRTQASFAYGIGIEIEVIN